MYTQEQQQRDNTYYILNIRMIDLPIVDQPYMATTMWGMDNHQTKYWSDHKRLVDWLVSLLWANLF